MVARCFSSSAGGVDLPDSRRGRPSGRDDEHAVEWEVEAQRGVASSCQADHGTKVASEGPAIPRECRKLTCAGVERLYNTVEIAAVKGARRTTATLRALMETLGIVSVGLCKHVFVQYVSVLVARLIERK